MRACESAPSRLRHLAGKTGTIRTAEFRGAEHLVVPVIALVEGVIHPANAPTPELVLASEFGRHPEVWNGRPVMVGHPKVNGEYVSANHPTVLEQAVGMTFGAVIKDKALHLEAWIDKTRALELGGDAARLIERLESGDQVEVSVGALLDLDETSGDHNGQRYAGVWRNVGSDHLAMLRDNEIGACSIEMGCGAPRTAKASGGVLSRLLSLFKPTPEAADTDRQLYADTASAARTLLGLRDAMTDMDLREALGIALRDAESGFLGVLAVEDNTRVIYHAFADGGGGVRMYARSFSLKGGKTVALKDDRAEVRAQTSFISVNAGSTPKAACGCGGGQGAAPAVAEGDSMDKKARIAALIASPKNHYGAAHQAFLESLTDDQLKALETADSAAPPAAAPAQTPAAPAAETAAATPQQPLTEEAFLAQAPDSIRQIVNQHKAAQASRKATLVTKLVAAQSPLTKEQLEARSLDDLEVLAAFAKVDAPVPAAPVDFSALGGAPRVAATTEKVEAAPDLTTSIRAARGTGK